MQKKARIKKYLNTIAEIFYEEYDESSFHMVLKYAVVLFSIHRTKSIELRARWLTMPWREQRLTRAKATSY